MSSRWIVAPEPRIVVATGQETVRESQSLVVYLFNQSKEGKRSVPEKEGRPRTLQLINQVADDRMSLEYLLMVVARTRC